MNRGGALGVAAPSDPPAADRSVTDGESRLGLSVRRLDPRAQLPVRAHPGDAGYDLVAVEGATLPAGGGRCGVRTGVALGLPVGWAAWVLPRSGLALHHGVTCLNAPGLIDSGYRGEVVVVLVNTDPVRSYEVRPGDRIAQLVLLPVPEVALFWSEELEPGDRGSGGFGHTGR